MIEIYPVERYPPFEQLGADDYIFKSPTRKEVCEWFEPRSISRSYSVIVRVRVHVVLKRTVAGD